MKDILIFMLFIMSLSWQSQASFNDSIGISYESLNEKVFGHTPHLNGSFAWEDPPWGEWELSVGLGKGSQVDRLTGSFFWIKRHKFNYKWQGFFKFGASFWSQDYYEAKNQEGQIEIKQRHLRASGKIGLEYSFTEKGNFLLSLSFNTYSKALHQFVEFESTQSLSDNSQQLLQAVKSLDQSWLFSTQIGFRYLFD